MATIEQLVQQGAAAKDIISTTTFEGKSWKVVTVETFAKMVALVERSFILQVLSRSKQDLDGFKKGVSIIMNHIGETKLEGLPLSIVSSMASSSKELVVMLAIQQVLSASGGNSVYCPNIIIDLEKGTYRIEDNNQATQGAIVTQDQVEGTASEQKE